MTTWEPLDRSLATLFADEAAAPAPVDLADRIVDVTARLRPRPAWRARIGQAGAGESPGTWANLRAQPTPRVWLFAALALLLAVSLVVAGALLLNRPPLLRGVFEPTGDLKTEVGLPLTLRLRNGSVLIAASPGFQRYDPIAGAFTSLGETDYQIRGWAEAANGDLLVVRIEEEPSEPPTGRSWVVVERLGIVGVTATSIEIGRSDFFYFQSAVALQDGRIAILGNDFGAEGLVALVFDPATGSFVRSGRTPLIANGEGATRLPDGRILVIDQPVDCPTMNVAIYDAEAGSFASLGSLPCASHFSTTVLGDGRVLVAGGGMIAADRLVGLSDEAYLIDPAAGTITPVDPLPEGRWMHAAALAADGRVLIAGGNLARVGEPTRSTLLFDPANVRFIAGPGMLNGRLNATAVALGDGRILIFGHTPLNQGGAVGPGPVAEIFR